MLFKERDKIIEVDKLEAIFRRTPDSHKVKSEIESDLKMKYTEIIGEREVVIH